jgi:hypothetical protein
MGVRRLVTTSRTIFHFGPWRVIPKRLIQLLRPAVNPGPEAAKRSMLGDLDANAIADEVRKNSVAVAGVLPAEFVDRLRILTDRLPVDQYKMMHQVDPDVRQLAEDPAVLSVLRAYLRAEPVLLESSIFITERNASRPPKLRPRPFHFDYAGWDSLSVFVYLSDVTAESSPHTVARGSHRDVGIRAVLQGCLTTEEAQLKYGDSIQVITGPAGTLFFENAEAFHCRGEGNKRRVLLVLLYASHRNWLSFGRTSRKHRTMRAQAYERFRAS